MRSPLRNGSVLHVGDHLFKTVVYVQRVTHSECSSAQLWDIYIKVLGLEAQKRPELLENLHNIFAMVPYFKVPVSTGLSDAQQVRCVWPALELSTLRGSLTFKLAVFVISIVIDCDRGHCYEHLKKKKSNSNEN